MSQAAFYPPQRLLQMNQDYDRTKLRLDFGGPSSSQSLLFNGAGSRKRRFMPMAMPSPALLQSPDLKLLKLGSPELEKIIINNNGFIPTPTPGGSLYPTEGGSSCQEDQERLAKGFIEALQKLQERDACPRWETATVGDSASERIESVDMNSGLMLPVTASGIHWKLDQNKNSVGVTTPVITNRLFAEGLIESQSSSSPPTLSRHPVATVSSAAPSYGSYMSRVSHSSTLASSFKLSHDLDRNSPKPVAMSLSSGSGSSSGLNLSASNSPLMTDQVKSEDESSQIVPSMAGDSTLSTNVNMNPINLEAQEQIKHERKKLRNRLAAQRCRKRKIEREETLKDKVKDLKAKNAELSTLASSLRMQVCELKQTVMHHVSEGCQVFMNQELKDDIRAASMSAVKSES